MADDEGGLRSSPNGVSDFVENSFLSYIIPQATDLDLEELSTEATGTGSVFDSIEQRKTLFFDETVDVHVILRTPLADETTLRSYLSRLHISLEAQIVNSQAQDRDGPPASDTIFEGVVEETDDPFIVVDAAEESDSDDEQSQPHVYAVWKLPVFLSRPRIRLQGPSVVFRASASLKPDDQSTAVGEKAGYLRSGVPAGFNLLDSLYGDPALQGVAPKLSALRVSRVAPVTQTKEHMQPIRTQSSLEINVFPAIHTRVRFSRPNTIPTSAALIALLEIDLTPHFDCKATIDSIKLSVPDATIENLNEQSGLTLPMTCVAHDHVTLLYRLAPKQLETTTKIPTRDLDITIEGTIHAIPGVCTPKLTLSWSTLLDFTLPVNPGFGSAPQAIQRAHRPSQLSIGGSEMAQSLTAPAVSRPDALPALEAATSRTTETAIPELGLTMTFHAPPGPLYPGEPFVWTVYVVNRVPETPATSRTTTGNAAAAAATTTTVPPRKLALVAIHKRRRNEARSVRPPSTSGRGKTLLDARQTADAVLDENVVHAMQRSSLVDTTEVLCLSADTRVGPLAAGACHVVELKFVALRPGIVGVEAIRVIDLGTSEHVDVRDLPVMVVEEMEEEGRAPSRTESRA
ncbi:hypothetical protein VDGD_08778 [Verticillium dahliae]|nr:hypothetical protein VDGD_08778 [Verticillium dahliae]